MNKRLYVGNLPYKTDEATLEALFSQAGPVAGRALAVNEARPRAARAGN